MKECWTPTPTYRRFMVRELRSLRFMEKVFSLSKKLQTWGKRRQTRNNNRSQWSLLKEDIQHLCCYCNSEEMMWFFSSSLCLNTQNWLIVNKCGDSYFVRVYYILTFCPFLNRTFYLKEIAGAIALAVFSKKEIVVALHCTDC